MASNLHEHPLGSSPPGSAVWAPTHRGSATLVFAFALISGFFILPRTVSAEQPADRVHEMDRLIDAIASRNEAPKLVGEERFAYPSFPEKFDWDDEKRVQKAAWALAQDDSNDLWGCLVKHFHDKRYSGTCQIDENHPWNYEVGTICVFIARNKLCCAHLLHLEPGKTRHYGGPTFNLVSEDSRDFLPDSLQRKLHYAPHLQETDALAKWYHAREGEPLYELQIEVCEWAVDNVENASGAAEKPKKDFVADVRKEIESLKRNKTPVVDHSPWASPMSAPNWKFYSIKDALRDRDIVLKQGRSPASSSEVKHNSE